ncbi:MULTISPECIES: 4'-phosphopantetheinyl transferase superfamily protein [unclassified Psychrobacter]|uniref:4'-phosphopantetheinyl transferase family protein n=1 Tax=unclassified Psychrobacter TaxID=196806 RepID=UPI0025B4F393|nr:MULTISPECIES: 4'-phosphopantetheinyl transferase superfamily protein [unclassified Psychrobacter]MDN3452336.1 4'-phosphopantetheinyl transferase superfamily protein [Psychrobacter sp. APC 3350]MDN3502269.1 4'-phosphopantetheinyl transferase superfamily protein [Psychrobacter sp. 5A.1]
MPTSNLTRIQYTQLDTTTWCVTAQVSESVSHLVTGSLWNKSLWLSSCNTSCKDIIKFNSLNWYYQVATAAPRHSVPALARKQRQQQRQGVRQLLQELLKKLSVNDTLDESGFPYRLVNSQYYVCFSHTGANHSKHTTKSNQTTGQNLPSKIAVVISRQRPAGIDIESNNIAWHVVRRFYSANEIALLEQLSTEQRDNTAKLLWQIKESFIKINQYTLAQGLGMDYSTLIPSLIEDDKKSLSFSISNETKKTRHRSAYRVATLHAQETIVVF